MQVLRTSMVLSRSDSRCIRLSLGEAGIAVSSGLVRGPEAILTDDPAVPLLQL